MTTLWGFINVPSVNTGKQKIKSIKVYKDHVTLAFFKGEKIKISKEAFVSSYLYEGKSLSKQEIAKLLEITAMSELLAYALQVVSKKHLSEKAMFDKLKAKEENFCVIKNVINKLKETGLLDDQDYMEDLIAWDNERCFGKNKIVKHLKDKGIPESLINKVKFSELNEKRKAKLLLPRLEKKYSQYAYENKKRHIYQALLRQGYDNRTAIEVADETKKNFDKVEKQILKKDYEKIKNRFSKKYQGYELKQKIYNALLSKGYKYQEIKTVLEDFVYEDDRGF